MSAGKNILDSIFTRQLFVLIAYGNMVESIMRATDEPFLLFHRPPAAEKSENRQKQYSSGKQSAGPSYSTATQDAFFFKKRRDPINWRLLSSINIDRLIREVSTFPIIYVAVITD
jgi:hypothetical protein